jgi:hypothetical protein
LARALRVRAEKPDGRLASRWVLSASAAVIRRGLGASTLRAYLRARKRCEILKQLGEHEQNHVTTVRVLHSPMA